MRYDMVVFDVGGTLVGLHRWEPFRDWLRNAGLPAAPGEARALHRRVLAAIRAARDDAQGLGADEPELYRWWQRVFEVAWPQRPDLAADMVRWLRADGFNRLYDDVWPVLRALRELGLPMAILSNFGTELEALLERRGVRQEFEIVVVSAAVGLAKPDRRIFDLLVAQAGWPRERTLYVGDHFGDDVEGARSAGLDAVLVDRLDRHSAAPCPRIRSLLDLVPYVQAPKQPAEAILLDMDGVVLDSMPSHLLTWQQTLAPLGIRLTASDLYPLEGVPTEATAQRLTEKLLGRACSTAEARALAETKQALFRENHHPAPTAGMVPLLHDLRGRGFRLGLVTGSARRVVDESLVPLRLAQFFETVVAGDQVTRGKPDPEPYRRAVERLGLPPEKCLVVENAPLGIQAATAAGMRCVALQTTLPAGELVGAESTFDGVAGLRAWILGKWAAAGHRQ